MNPFPVDNATYPPAAAVLANENVVAFEITVRKFRRTTDVDEPIFILGQQ